VIVFFTSIISLDCEFCFKIIVFIFFLLSSIADNFDLTSSIEFDNSKISFSIGFKSTALFFISDIISVNSKISNFISEILF
jgi:hypothetical protein